MPRVKKMVSEYRYKDNYGLNVLIERPQRKGFVKRELLGGGGVRVSWRDAFCKSS